jgi:hypothetical protein
VGGEGAGDGAQREVVSGDLVRNPPALDTTTSAQPGATNSKNSRATASAMNAATAGRLRCSSNAAIGSRAAR